MTLYHDFALFVISDKYKLRLVNAANEDGM